MKLQQMKESFVRFQRRNAIKKAMRKGAKYLMNLPTREIHDLTNTQSNCHLDWITKPVFIKEEDLKYYQRMGANGCRFCMKKEDKG